MNKKLILKKEFNRKYLLTLLLKSKNYQGTSTIKLNSNILPYLCGIRNKNSIIDLEHTINNLKRSLSLIQDLIKKNKKILIIGNDFQTDLFKSNFLIKENKKVFFFEKNWENGFLTKKKNIKIDLIIIFSMHHNKYLLREAEIKNIPIISIIDTDRDPNKFTYPIISNDKHLKSLFVLIYIFRKIFFKK